MDDYLKMQSIQGLIVNLRQDLWEIEDTEFGTEMVKRQELINKYYSAIKEIINETPHF